MQVSSKFKLMCKLPNEGKPSYEWCLVLLLQIAGVQSAHAQLSPREIAASSPTVKAAVQQINTKDFASAEQTLMQGIYANQNDVAARRYLAYVLVERQNPKQALEQLKLLPNLTPFDLFTKGSALGATGQPVDSTVCLEAAVRMEPLNDMYRTKAIEALIVLSDYTRAGALCAEGARMASTPAKKKQYEEQFEHMHKLAAIIAQGKNCPGHR